VSPKEDAPKRAAIDLDDVAGKRLTEISAAEFLQLLEQVQAGAYPPPSDEATVGDVLAGAASAQRLGAGGLPEKKKLERETFPEKKKVELEKQPVEGFPEKKKVELEKQQVEGYPEKKKVELEKQSGEGFPEKKKVELEKQSGEGFPEKKKVELEKPDIEKQSVEPPSDLATTMSQFDDRLATIEQQLSKLST